MHHRRACLLSGLFVFSLILSAFPSPLMAQSFPQYNHVFVIILESEGIKQVIGNQDAPILTALANDYGLASNYSGVGDPSEPNYVGMLGGDTFGITTDDPYWFPGNTINAPNLMGWIALCATQSRLGCL